MGKLLKLTILIISLTTSTKTDAQDINADSTIRNIVYQYEIGLNNNVVEKITKLFTNDGVLILQGAPTIIGMEQINDFYTSLFKNLDFNLKFNIEEIIQMSPNWVLVRTTTSGIITFLPNNSSNPGNGHEIFIVNKQTNGNWVIARYSGSSSK